MPEPRGVANLNAGVGVGGDFARQTELQAELELIDLNVRSSVHLAKLALREMIPRNKGRLLITSSVAATMPAPFEAVYGASKKDDAFEVARDVRRSCRRRRRRPFTGT